MPHNKSRWILIRLTVALVIILLTVFLYFQSVSLSTALELGAFIAAISIIILAVAERRYKN